MITPLLIIVNCVFLLIAFRLFSRKGLLSFFQGGRWWLTWLSVGVITLMDELTSIFYAPSEAFRHIGLAALVFIPLTAIFIHYMTTRMVEIARILDFHNLRGGGVYNFSYLVLGPTISFVAVASIMVDYILTAAISTVSAVENSTSFLGLSAEMKIGVEILIIWAVAGLNILGIRENAKVTFGIFLGTAIVFLNLLMIGFADMAAPNLGAIQHSINHSWGNLTGHGFFGGYSYLIAAISSCILAYSGIESVLQTSNLVTNWKQVAKAYIFLALSVGLLTPLITIMVLSTPGLDFVAHEGDLITYFATLKAGPIFGILMALVACITLIMAVNTAFVASSELIERVAHRYGFNSVIKTNRRASLYRVHIANAGFFSLIVLATQGKQMQLAEMYAVGLVASFVINLGTLLIYRYFKGTKEVQEYNVTRTGTLFFFTIILSCFIYLSYHKPHGFVMWFGVTVVCLLLGVYGTRKRAPELVQLEKGESPMDIIFYVAESAEENIHVYFKRPLDAPPDKSYGLGVFITFYSPRQPIPPRLSPAHFRIPFKRASVYQNILAILHMLAYELPHKNITINFGWPASSWFDRLSIGVMVFQFMKTPKLFPTLNFKIEQFKTKGQEIPATTV